MLRGVEPEVEAIEEAGPVGGGHGNKDGFITMNSHECPYIYIYDMRMGTKR